jgi:hypothetical protein
MKTKEDMIKEGYPENWPTECEYCCSYDCHEYNDRTICFDCKKHFNITKIITSTIKENENIYDRSSKLSGNIKQRRFFGSKLLL